MGKKRHINLTIDEDLISKVKKQCKLENRSISSFIEILIRNHFSIEGSEELTTPLTIEALKKEIEELKKSNETYSTNMVERVLKALSRQGFISKKQLPKKKEDEK